MIRSCLSTLIRSASSSTPPTDQIRAKTKMRSSCPGAPSTRSALRIALSSVVREATRPMSEQAILAEHSRSMNASTLPTYFSKNGERPADGSGRRIRSGWPERVADGHGAGGRRLRSGHTHSGHRAAVHRAIACSGDAPRLRGGDMAREGGYTAATRRLLRGYTAATRRARAPHRSAPPSCASRGMTGRTAPNRGRPSRRK